MHKTAVCLSISCLVGGFAVASPGGGAPDPGISMALVSGGVTLNAIGRYESGVPMEGATEIAAFDPVSQRLFVTNGDTKEVDIVDVSDATNPALIGSLDLSALGRGANSVAVHDGVLAAAIQANNKQDNGVVAFFDTDGNLLNVVTAGALPDMVTFSPNGRYVLSANEGEPNDEYTVDPEGSITIINISDGVANIGPEDVVHATFEAWNTAPVDPSVRIFGPGASPAQDLEPEYITVDHDSKTAWVTLQENNAIAIIDIEAGEVSDVVGLGFKDHMAPGNGLDASNKDGAINIRNWPVNGQYMPDSIASFQVKGATYLVTSNEGDIREYGDYADEERVKDLVLDPTAFPDAAALQLQSNLGRLKVTPSLGDTDGDGDFDALYSFGARSMAVWDASGNQVADTGDELERITAAAEPLNFNSDDEENDSFDSRSDDTGPDPEGITVGRAFGTQYAFVGLEKQSGVVVYDVSNPAAPRAVSYVNTRDFSGDVEAGTAGDVAPEGMLFVKAEDSPTGNPMLMVSFEISGTITMFEVVKN